MNKNVLVLLSLSAISPLVGMDHEISIFKTNKTPQEETRISFDEYQKMGLLESFTTDKKVQMTREQRQKLSYLKTIAINSDARILLKGTAITATFGALSFVAAYQGYPKTAIGLGAGAALSAVGTTAIILAPPR